MHQVLICDIYITAANLLIRNLELCLGRKEKTVLNTLHKLEHSPCFFSGAFQYLKHSQILANVFTSLFVTELTISHVCVVSHSPLVFHWLTLQIV